MSKFVSSNSETVGEGETKVPRGQNRADARLLNSETIQKSWGMFCAQKWGFNCVSKCLTKCTESIPQCPLVPCTAEPVLFSRSAVFNTGPVVSFELFPLEP